MQKVYSSDNIATMDDLFRRAFVNSLTGFKSVCLIGSQTLNGKTNLAIFSQVFHIGANPALIGILVRPDKSPRHTLENILATKYFTINHIREEYYKNAHQTSARYSADVSEFEACGFTPEYSSAVNAPYVKEANVKIGLNLVEKNVLAINQTVLLIGEVKEVIVPDDCVLENGYIDIEKAGSITCSSLESYHVTKRLARLSYSKPDTFPTEL
jgi:flavin reductase (DIM6/NTAB) family NADH-FMN oxidoreductase RutF